MSYYTVPNLTISLDGSHLFAVTHGRGTPGRRATGISTADLTVTYDAPADLVKDDMDHPGLIGQVLTHDGKTLTMTSLVDGSQMTFEPTQAPVAAIGQYVYVAQRPEAGASLESLSILDLTSGQSTLLEDSTLGYQAFTKASPEIVDAFFTRQYVVYLKKDEELAVYRLGEGRPLLTRSWASGAAIPAGAAAYGGYLYAAYGEDSDQLTMTDLTTGQDVGTASYTGTDIQFVSHFGALGNSCLAPATEWAAAP